MPPFTYQSYANPFVQSITSLLTRPGDIDAARAQAVANAQSQAALQSGQAWAGAANQIGQTVAAIPQQMQAQKMQALQMQDIQGQIAERNARAAEMQRNAQIASAGKDAIQSSLNPDGTIDHEKAASLWEQAPIPGAAAAANAYRESLQKTQQTSQALEEGRQKIEQGKQQMATAAANHFGELAAAGLDKIASGATPLEVRDYTTGLVANAASYGLIQSDQAQQFLMQAAQAQPGQLAPVFQKILDAAPAVKERILSDQLKAAETAKNVAEAKKNEMEAAAGPKPTPVTEAQLDAEQQRILAKQASGQPLLPSEQASMTAYEQRKRTVSDPALIAANNRQASTQEQQNKLEQDRQNFQMQQAGRKELGEKIETPYQTALASAQTLRDVVAAAKAGNKVAASLQSLETTMSAIRAQGLNRINSAEIGVTANAGDLWDKLQGWVGKATAGQPVPPDIQKDMAQFAGILEKAAYNKYKTGFDSVTNRYKLGDEKALPGPVIYARDPQGVLHSAPYGSKLPTGWVEQ